MNRSLNLFRKIIIAATVFPFCALAAAAQTGSAQPQHQAPAATAQVPSDQDVADTQEQLLKLLRLSPVLTTVVAHDPSLLADQAYVARNNPELAQFLAAHPDIAKNPEFYLFSRLGGRGERREQVLERAVWPDMLPGPQFRPSDSGEVMDRIAIIIVLPALFFAIAWIFRLFVQSHRWNRTLKQQNEIHARLIDKFSSSQELAAYMETEVGKRFLSASPIPLESEAPPSRMPNAVARVLTPLQVGVVLTLLGIGLLLIRHVGQNTVGPLTVLGVLAVMPGIGFILSAAATWVIAHRLGLMPGKADAHFDGNSPSGLTNRQ